MATYYTVYKTTNLLNGKFYIGVHQTDNLEDDYLGSGKALKLAIRKYGREAFSREFLAVFQSPEEMFALEEELVCEALLSQPDCYNIVKGGFTAAVAHNAHPDWRWARQKGALERNKQPIAETTRAKLSESNKRRWLKGENPNWCFDWTGRKHREETKRKIGDANRVSQAGDRNSQHGTVWMCNLAKQTNRKVSADQVEEMLAAGWQRGRKMKW